jgi:flagellar biosynthetic protein FliR
LTPVVNFTLDSLYTWINSGLWPFIRLLALMTTAPVLGEASIPTRVRIGLAALIALAIAPALPAPPAISPASYEGMWIIVQQIAIGMGLGLVMRIAFASIQTAGELIGLQMGLSFASFFDPSTGANTTVLARLMNMVAMLVFLALDGHLLLLQGLVHTFQSLPAAPGAALDTGGWQVLFQWSSQVLTGGLLLAFPLVMTLLCINLALGILNRTAQQLSVFAVGFPITLTTGMLLLTFILPQTAPYMARLFNTTLHVFTQLSNALAGI